MVEADYGLCAAVDGSFQNHFVRRVPQLRSPNEVGFDRLDQRQYGIDENQRLPRRQTRRCHMLRARANRFVLEC